MFGVEDYFSKPSYSVNSLLDETKNKTQLGQWILNLEYDGKTSVGDLVAAS